MSRCPIPFCWNLTYARNPTTCMILHGAFNDRHPDFSGWLTPRVEDTAREDTMARIRRVVLLVDASFRALSPHLTGDAAGLPLSFEPEGSRPHPSATLCFEFLAPYHCDHQCMNSSDTTGTRTMKVIAQTSRYPESDDVLANISSISSWCFRLKMWIVRLGTECVRSYQRRAGQQ